MTDPDRPDDSASAPDAASGARASADDRASRLRAQALDAPRISPQAFTQRTRRSFVTGGLGALAAVLGWRWIGAQPQVDGIPAVLRSNHRLAERAWRGLQNPDALAPTFPVSASAMPRVNGRHGLGEPLDRDTWAVRVLDADGAEIDRVGLDAIRELPQVEMTTELKCIEGWSQIVHWGGARFSDFAARYGAAAETEYVGLATPDGGYTVGMDMASMRHPQTLLCTLMQGEPLEPLHGAPLRLVTPLKYGVKHLKRIGVIRFMDARPEDYWAERGYDWYIGH